MRLIEYTINFSKSGNKVKYYYAAITECLKYRGEPFKFINEYTINKTNMNSLKSLFSVDAINNTIDQVYEESDFKYTPNKKDIKVVYSIISDNEKDFKIKLKSFYKEYNRRWNEAYINQ